MTDIEISKALALAIGWPANRMQHMTDSRGISHICCLTVPNCIPLSFDYRDWAVIGPIAEKYNSFPSKPYKGSSWRAPCGHNWVFGDTPQKAIALAVIGGVK